MFVRTSGAQVPSRDQSNPARASEPGRPAFEALKRRVAEDLMGLGPDAASRGETPRDRRWYPHDPGPVDWFIDPFKRQVGDMYGAIVDAVTNLPVGAETAAAIQRWFPKSDKPLDTSGAGIWPDRKTGLLDIRPPDSYAPRVPVPNGSNIGEPFTFNDRDMHVYDYAFNMGPGGDLMEQMPADMTPGYWDRRATAKGVPNSAKSGRVETLERPAGIEPATFSLGS